ncbi:MAG: trehalase family glycosidase [Lentisphaeria bacterium]|jgi:hypothetical protein|nr:trehalase family glycosidase [Lentisphaeria bacterium]
MNPNGSFSPQERQWIREQADVARQALLNNIRQFEQYSVPLLLAGDVYEGIWLEHNQDNIFLAEYHPEAAWASQQIFMDYQREDGLLPFMFPLRAKGGYFNVSAAYWHVQSVLPFARCAMEIADRLGKGEETFAAIYHAAARYDQWLATHRNRKGTGLVEMYCEWDVGHDNSPRVTDGGIPHGCPDREAANMPDIPCMPVLSVDLSAMLYGGRMALAELARRLGREADERRWREQAGELRSRIRDLLYDPVDDYYYDRDQAGFRRYRSEHITRLFLNRVIEQDEFDRLYDRYFANETEFWTPYPFSSMSVSDPSFVKACPKNCWGANTQGLTLLRALFWMPDYGRDAELRELLRRWLQAFVTHPNPFAQELNPFDGTPVGTGVNYSPSLILFIQAARTLGILA